MAHVHMARRRLARQGLSSAPFKRAEDVVGWLVAMQSQERGIAPWSVGQRTRAAKLTDVQRALERGAILRTHVLRPTWHYIREVDARWLLDLTAPRVLGSTRSYFRREGIDEPLMKKARRVLEKELRGGRHLTREELGRAFASRRLELAANRLGFVMMQAELDRVVCSGAPRGKQHTYALFDERVPAAPELGRTPLAELALRFFTARGPATLADFAWWSGLTRTQVRRGIEEVAGELTSFEDEGRTYWESTTPVEVGEDGGFHWLQAYDESLVSYSDSRHVHGGPPPGSRSGPVELLHVLTHDGRIVGRWRRRSGKLGATLEVRLSARLDRAQRAALGRSLARFSDFHGEPAEVHVLK
jgi:hypothetical protein